jgi:hypothetical protein
MRLVDVARVGRLESAPEVNRVGRHEDWFSAVALACVVIAGCEGDQERGASASASETSRAVAEGLSSAGRFDKDIRKRACEILTPALVARTFDVPEGELAQVKMMGCTYTWKNEREELEASVTMVRAHGSVADAARWFRNATMDKTAEELAEDKARVARRVDESERFESEAQRETAKSLMAMLPSEGVSFEDVEGIGDAARVGEDGTLYVRVDNLTFHARAYKGPRPPELDVRGIKPQEIIAAAKARNSSWAKETAPQRKRDAATLAKAFASAL